MMMPTKLYKLIHFLCKLLFWLVEAAGRMYGSELLG